MHNLLVQCLIALISKEFSPEEFREILEETKGIPLTEKALYWTITGQLDQARESLRARFNHPNPPRYNHREVVKDFVVKDARPEEETPPGDFGRDETPVDWQPRPCYACDEQLLDGHTHTYTDAQFLAGDFPHKGQPRPVQPLHAKMDFSNDLGAVGPWYQDEP